MFLALQVLILVRVHLHLVFNSRDLYVAILDGSTLSFELNVEFAILSAALILHSALLVNLCPQGLYESDIRIRALSIVVFHGALIFTQLSEVLFKSLQLILQGAVVTLPCS